MRTKGPLDPGTLFVLPTAHQKHLDWPRNKCCADGALSLPLYEAREGMMNFLHLYSAFWQNLKAHKF